MNTLPIISTFLVAICFAALLYCSKVANSISDYRETIARDSDFTDAVPLLNDAALKNHYAAVLLLCAMPLFGILLKESFRARRIQDPSMKEKKQKTPRRCH